MTKEQFTQRCLETAGSIYVRLKTVKGWRSVPFVDLPEGYAMQFIEQWWLMRGMKWEDRKVIEDRNGPAPDALWRELPKQQ